MTPHYTTQLVRINGIAGILYRNGQKTTTVVVYGIGAPLPPDSGALPDAPVIMRFAVDLFVPDYIGYGRSDGQFTPTNCIKTFTNLYSDFTRGCLATNAYDKTTLLLRYKRVIFIGRSLGGTYIPLLPRFNPAITELAIFCPVVNSRLCGSVPGEESNADFLRSMRQDGYYHLYRGILAPLWRQHLENKDDLSPMDNISHLAHARLFIAHGRQDSCVHYSKSQQYYDLICKQFPGQSNQFALNLYNGTHGPSTTNPAVADFLRWLGLETGSTPPLDGE